MTRRAAVDLSAHINETVERGHPADFPVVLKPLYYFAGPDGGGLQYLSKRLAVVRNDTGEALSVVSDRYRLVYHQDLLAMVQQATSTLDVGPVPRGIYVDRGGARMRALFKFPALAQPVQGKDNVCPCIRITNSYDATSRISVHIGSFRFVCTNLAVGGGGVFASGFMSIHAGEIPINEIAEKLRSYLTGFDAIIETYRRWNNQRLDWEAMGAVIDDLPTRAGKRIERAVMENRVNTVYTAYNSATRYATHEMRSARSAFDLLEQINAGFQRYFSSN